MRARTTRIGLALLATTAFVAGAEAQPGSPCVNDAPNPNVFNRDTILAGWGSPTKLGKDNDAEVFFYQEGLIVKFDPEGWLAVDMVFTPHQPAETRPPK